jgi:hypothetical protein
MQVAAASLVAVPAPRVVRGAVATVGIAAFLVVATSWSGTLPDRLVDPLNRITLAGIEVSQSVAAAIALRRLDRRWFSRLAWASALVVAVCAPIVGSGIAAGHRVAGLAVAGTWLGSRLLRYFALIRLALSSGSRG